MSDDLTPTRQQPTDLIAAQLEAYRTNPSATGLLRDLRAALSKAERHAELADVLELAAGHGEPSAAAEFWAAAGEAHRAAGQRDRAIAAFRAALARDAAEPTATAGLVAELTLAHRFADAAAALGAEITELDRRGGGRDHAARLAERHRVLAHLWQDELGRLDRALIHWQRAFQLEPKRTESLTAARDIYASLGKDEMVAQLYAAELEVLGTDAQATARRAEIEHALGRLALRNGHAGVAAAHLERALSAAPDAHDTRETLAELYASPAFSGKPEQSRASELFVELGREQMGGDKDTAITFLRRAIGANPYSRAGTENLEDALERSERWDELDRMYRDRLAVTEDEAERAELLRRRATLLDERVGDGEALKRCLEELAAIDPDPAHLARLRALYGEDGDFTLLAAVIERGLAELEDQPPRLAAELLELATILRERLAEKDRAADCLHRVLSVDPGNQEAHARYADHFRERRDWRGLADLTEFAIETARDAGEAPSELARRLEELAQLCEVRLGDVERAIATWQRILELEPDLPRGHEALRRLMSRAKMWESLVGMLEQEAYSAVSPEARVEALRRIAQVFRERQVNPRRAIQLYEEVVGVFPDDEAALKALAELYEREGDDAGLAATMRRQLDLESRKLVAELELQGKAVEGAREWPVARRVERLTMLRRLAVMYDQKLGDVEGMVFACGGVLEILPGDRDALERLERGLERIGDLARLEQTLEYHSASASGPAEKAKVLRRLARIGAERGDEIAAMERWEAVLKAVPSDLEALDALAELYDRHQRWGELAAVLERSALTSKPTEVGTATAAKRAADVKRYAQVVDDKLGDPARATRAWRRLLELLPRERDALAALARLHEQHGQWRELAEVLDRQVPLYQDDDPRRAADLALRRARLLEERLGAPADAIKALELIIGELDPANLAAHQALRRLYEARGDFEAAVRVLEREMVLTEEPARRVARGLEIGLLCRDRLSDPARALMAFERVLELEPDHEEALGAVAELYAQVGDHARHALALERRLERTVGDRERRGVMLRIAQVTADKLGEPRAAFTWLRRAHGEAPDGATLAELRRAAETFGLWAELAEVFEDERRRIVVAAGAPSGRIDELPAGAPGLDRPAYLAASRELAATAERRLGDRLRAIATLHEALTVEPGAADLLADAERIAGEGDDRALWHVLVECLDQPLRVADAAGRVALHQRRARIREERLADRAGASDELMRAFASAPDDPAVAREIRELAERSGAWSDAIALEAALAERAATVEGRLASLRRRAQLIEDKVGDAARAFRVHLQAFLVAPDDAETQAQLWRLARAIGAYAAADQTPRPEPPAAHVERVTAGVPAPLLIEPSRPRRDATEEISVTDLLALRPGAPPPGRPAKPRDRTLPLEIADLVEVRGKKKQSESTVELSTSDLIQALGALRAPPPTPGKRPPPPPAKRPPPPRAAEPRRPAAPGLPPMPVRVAAPSLPIKSYASPWEELATAVELLPAPDLATRLRLHYRAAEIWERGAADVGRAFDVLARALGQALDDAELRARLYRLAGEHGQWDRLAELYEAAAEDAASPTQAASIYLEVAEIRTAQSRPRDAETLYRRVLGMRPEDALAREKLEALYRDESRWVDLAALLEERTDPRLGSAAPLAERPNLLRELAGLYRDKLGHKHDAIDALERLRQIVPDDVELMRELAALYAEIGRWSKVIEVMGRLADSAEGTPEAREALRRVGQIYETELELPDRAIDAYRELADKWPNDLDAFDALDRLYDQHARWRELDDILRRRAALSKEPDERADLLRRRARVLIDWLDAPEEAAAALRHARTIRPEDPELADDLVAALIASKKTREAAAVLEGRLAALEGKDAAAGDLAALHLHLAGLRADALKDFEGARQSLERALALVPDHPSALARLARLAESQRDPRAFAEARLREADVLADSDQKIAALIDAGTALRDQCGDVARARVAFERVLQIRPYHADASWALAGLVEQGGDLERAAQILEARLADASLAPEERAQVYTQLAALSRQAGVDAAAERHLSAALEVVPEHLPAIFVRADLLAERGRDEELADFLEAIIPRLEAKPAEARAELLRRLALAFERRDGAEEAYQTLLEADKLNRASLLVKLALGENRYRARRWREAALHLSALANHPQAELHPAEVAEGLYHAALAEIRSLRPEKAEALYERAIALKPNFVLALQALAELALERGDSKRALDLLTRRASATTDDAERLRLFESLGDMALDTLGDPLRAKLCYEAAVHAAVPLEGRHLGLLAKLATHQAAAGDAAGAARTAELMGSFAATASERASRYAAAATGYLSAGHDDRARAAAERAVDADPYDLTAVTILSRLALGQGDLERTTEVLGRALHGREPADEAQAAQHAALWAQLGEARDRRGDRKGAIAALQSAIAAAPSSPGAMSARRRLVPLWHDDEARAPVVREFRRVLAAESLAVEDVTAYARALRDHAEADAGRVALELAAALGHAPDPADVTFLGRHPARAMADDEAYRGTVGAALRARLIADRDDEPLGAVLAALWDAAPMLWSSIDEALARAGITGARRVAATTDSVAATLWTRIARAAEAPASVLYATDAPGAPDVQVVCVAPPVVVLGPRMLRDELTRVEMRFLLGRAAEQVRPERIAAAALPAGELAALVASLGRLFGKSGEIRPEDDKLRTTLPVRVRSQLDRLLTAARGQALEVDRYLQACQRAADRLGLLLCGEIDVALRLAGGPGAAREPARHLVELSLAEGYLEARAGLGVGAAR